MKGHWTPGPWHFCGGGIGVLNGAGIDLICPLQRPPQDAFDLREWQSNAELIAAAPELFSALERAERKLRAYVGICSGDKELTETVLPMAATSLAKARGIGR